MRSGFGWLDWDVNWDNTTLRDVCCHPTDMIWSCHMAMYHYGWGMAEDEVSFETITPLIDIVDHATPCCGWLLIEQYISSPLIITAGWRSSQEVFRRKSYFSRSWGTAAVKKLWTAAAKWGQLILWTKLLQLFRHILTVLVLPLATAGSALLKLWKPRLFGQATHNWGCHIKSASQAPVRVIHF